VWKLLHLLHGERVGSGREGFGRPGTSRRPRQRRSALVTDHVQRRPRHRGRRRHPSGGCAIGVRDSHRGSQRTAGTAPVGRPHPGRQVRRHHVPRRRDGQGPDADLLPRRGSPPREGDPDTTCGVLRALPIEPSDRPCRSARGGARRVPAGSGFGAGEQPNPGDHPRPSRRHHAPARGPSDQARDDTLRRRCTPRASRRPRRGWGGPGRA
jgi:hypothetical protein